MHEQHMVWPDLQVDCTLLMASMAQCGLPDFYGVVTLSIRLMHQSISCLLLFSKKSSV
jgi:hypothetical protein